MKTLAFLLLTSFSLHAAAQDYVLTEDRLSSGYLSWHYVNSLYAKMDVTAMVKNPNLDSLELPQYSLFEGGISYKYPFGKKQSITVLANVNNIFYSDRKSVV